METKKENRGRKPVKDKKSCLRLYIHESKIKKMGGEARAATTIYEFVDLKTKPKKS